MSKQKLNSVQARTQKRRSSVEREANSEIYVYVHTYILVYTFVYMYIEHKGNN